MIGEQLTLNDMPYTIVGVMPPSFTVRAWGSHRAVYVPLALSAEDRAVRENHNLQAIARLAPGVDVTQATAELEVIARRLEQEYPKENAGWGATVVTLRDVLVGDIRLSLLMLLGAVALVLLIACANVGNLLFARALSRRKETRDPRGARRGPRTRVQTVARRGDRARGRRRHRGHAARLRAAARRGGDAVPIKSREPTS